MQQRPQPRVYALDVLAGQWRGEHLVRVVEQVVDVARTGGRVSLVQRPVGVGRSEDPVTPPGNHQQHGLLGAQDHARRGLQPVARHHQMDAFGRSHVDLPARVGQALRVVGPDSGRVDDLLGAHRQLAPGLQVDHPRTGHPLALPFETGDRHSVGGESPVGHRRAHQHHGVPRVVDLGVPVLHGPGQRGLLQAGRLPQRPTTAQVAVVGQPAGLVAHRAHGVVEHDAGADVRALPQVMLQWVQERHRAHEVRRQALQQQATLAHRLTHQPEVEHLQVPNAAVDQLAGPAGGAASPVALIDDRGRQPARDGIQGRPGADDAAAHDQDVQLVRARHLGHRLGACLRRQGSTQHS